MVWKKDEHAYTWNDLDGHVAPEILCIPRTGSDPTGTWPKVHARVLGYVMRNVRGKPWIDHLALIAAVMTAQQTSAEGRPLPYRTTRVWVRRDGHWQLALSQQTVIEH